MTTIHFIVCLLHGCFAQPAPVDFNPFRDFRPVQHAEKLVNPFAHPTQAHPIAYECTVDDRECIAKHDDAVLTLAVMTTDRLTCARGSTRPQACRDTYDMLFGNFRIPIIDLCAIVVRITNGTATLYAPRTQTTRKVPAHVGWTPGVFVGKCDVQALQPLLKGGLQAFPWSTR